MSYDDRPISVRRALIVLCSIERITVFIVTSVDVDFYSDISLIRLV